MKKTWLFIALGLVVCLVLAAVVSPWASSDPDGLEKVSQDKGFSAKEQESAWKWSFMPDYWSEDADGKATPIKKALAGVAGTLIVFALGFGAAKLIARRKAAQA
jgi:hypothetical protein